MFRYTLTFFLAVCCLGFSSAQKHACSTEFNSGQMDRMLKLRDLESTRAGKRNITTYIPIKFHVASQPDGAGKPSFEAVLDQLCALNVNYEDYGYQFYMKDGTVNNVANNTIYFSPSTAAGISKMVAEKQQFGSNAVNIFITENADTDGLGTTLGYYTFNQDYIVLKKSVISNGNHRKFVLGHELGHFFNLPHTFNGWDSQPWDGMPVTSTTSPGGELNELADGSNGEIAGDMIADTPADYNLGFGWNGCTEYDGGCADPTGALLDPDESNIMGYFIGCEKYTVSEKQIEIITNDYESNRRAHLRVSYQPMEAEITETASVISPPDDSTTPFSNSVELSWTSVPNATHYYVELSQGLSKSNYITEDTKLFITGLSGDRSYRWRVVPYNELYTCAASSSSWEFRTGTGTTRIEDSIEVKNQVDIYPNPTSKAEINFELELDHTGEVSFDLFSIDGNKVFQKSIVYTGKTIQNMRDLNLRSGFYILRVNFGTDTILRKVIVNE